MSVNTSNTISVACFKTFGAFTYMKCCWLSIILSIQSIAFNLFIPYVARCQDTYVNVLTTTMNLKEIMNKSWVSCFSKNNFGYIDFILKGVIEIRAPSHFWYEQVKWKIILSLICQMYFLSISLSLSLWHTHTPPPPPPPPPPHSLTHTYPPFHHLVL